MKKLFKDVFIELNIKFTQIADNYGSRPDMVTKNIMDRQDNMEIALSVLQTEVTKFITAGVTRDYGT